MRYILFILYFLVLIPVIQAEDSYLTFSTLPELPPNEGYSFQPGLAGLYAGVDNDVLIVAGGANFPDKVPGEGGTKEYYDEIFILQKDGAGEYLWKKSRSKLPFKAGYGGAVSTRHGLLYFGGNTEKEVVAQSWFLKYNPESEDLEIKPGPELPVSLTNFAFAMIDNRIFVAGGQNSPDGISVNTFYSLDISGSEPSGWKWEQLPSWQGKSRAFAVGAAQSNGLTNCFYLFSGRNISKNNELEVLYDAHVYDPSIKKWSVISEGKNKEFPFMAGTAFATGASSVIFTSGADGEQLKKQMSIEKQIAELSAIRDKDIDNEPGIKSLQKELLSHLDNHPGFGNRVFAFNTLTGKVYQIAESESSGQVTTTAVKWNDEIIIPSGEIRPGIRTPGILKISLKKDAHHLKYPDIIVITLYFLILAGMGWFFSRRQKNTEDYFRAGGRIPWWAAGLSIFGTALSAITFMAIPAKTFATDWSYFMLNMTIFMAAPIIVFLFVPFYRKLNVTSAYEFLENRFNYIIRLVGSLSFIIFQIGRMGVVLFLPSIALNVVTGIDIFICIALMGFVSLIYTMMGGIEAVVWTDVMQVIVLLGGAILSIALIIINIEGGFPEIIKIAGENQKFNILDLTLSLKQPTVWVMLLGGIFANITTYGTDQTMVQRYMTTKTQKETVRSIWTNAILTIPATLIFFFIGTALFAFYTFFPAEMNPVLQNNDAIFPWYIASQLPSGVSGLLIAGIFAAAMSTLSSSMNSAATAYATDIHFRLNLSRGKSSLQVARITTLIIGLTGILFAFMMATMNIQSLWDEFQKILGLVIGSLGGVFLLGILTKRANSPGVLTGIITSIIIQIIVAVHEPVHLLAYSATGVISCFLSGYIASLLFKK